MLASDMRGLCFSKDFPINGSNSRCQRTGLAVAGRGHHRALWALLQTEQADTSGPRTRQSSHSPARLLAIVKSLCLLDQVREKELGDAFEVFSSRGSQGL